MKRNVCTWETLFVGFRVLRVYLKEKTKRAMTSIGLSAGIQCLIYEELVPLSEEEKELVAKTVTLPEL